MTSWVIFVTVDFVTVILSMLPFAMPGMSKPGVFVSVYSRVGLLTSIVYGPMPGMPRVALNGAFAAGVGAALARPIANRNLPSGSESLTTISPVASSAVMPRDVGVFLLGLDVLGDALDRRRERRERAAEEVQPLDRVLEVRGLDGGAVGVLQALAQLEGVGLLVGRDRRHRLGEAGDEVRAGGAGLVLVGHEARVDELQRLVGLHGLEHHRVVVVRQDAADLDRAALLLGRVAVI